jgi:hypothetical protein
MPHLGAFPRPSMMTCLSCLSPLPGRDGGASLAAQLSVSNSLPPIDPLLALLPPEPVPIRFIHAQLGLPYDLLFRPSEIESLLRYFYELVPVLPAIIHSDSYRTNPSDFWSGCLHARALAQLFTDDSTLIPSVDALTVLHTMRAQGVDWLQWLAARPEISRRERGQTLHREDDDGDDERDPRISPNQSADDRLATLSERREFLRTDDGATRISRVCLAVASEALVCSVLGGQLDVYADTFERHSYEAELAAFQDHLAATANSCCAESPMHGSSTERLWHSAGSLRFDSPLRRCRSPWPSRTTRCPSVHARFTGRTEIAAHRRITRGGADPRARIWEGLS